MRKSAVFFCLLLAIGSGLRAAQAAPEGTKTIKIVPDPAFGQGVAWDTIFKKELDKYPAFLPDGGFFFGSSREGKIYKFDPSGRILGTIGRKGQGPGDLQGIAALDILDGTKLVVHEGRRLSLFDLDGNFQKNLSVSGAIWAMTALRNGKVALVREISAGSDPKWFKGRYSVLILDVGSGTEKEIASFDYAVPRGEFLIRITQFDRYVRLAKTDPGTLILAFPSSPEILLHSLDGEKSGSFKLEIEPVKFTWDILAFIMDFNHDAKSREIMTLNKSKVALPEYLPYHLGIAGDSEGRSIVYENSYARETRQVSFLVYSREGKLLTRIAIDPGPYEPVRPLGFQNGYAYGWLAEKDGDGTFVLGRWKTGF